MTAEVKEAKVDLNKNLPSVKCPNCGKEYFGWALETKIGQEDQCGECGQKFVLV